MTNGAEKSASVPFVLSFSPSFSFVAAASSLRFTIMLHNLVLTVVVVVVATPPLAAADHCYPTVEFNRQEPRPGGESTKGRKLEVGGGTFDPVTFTNSITVFVLPWEVGHRKKPPPALFHPPPCRDCEFTLKSPDPWYTAVLSPWQYILFDKTWKNKVSYLCMLMHHLRQSSITNHIVWSLYECFIIYSIFYEILKKYIFLTEIA